jgi:alkylation response protein AidB-like acyl-CoA dehydrogenase
VDFSLPEGQRELADLTRRILTDHPAADDRTLWTTLASAGVLDAALPESVGGAGLGFLAQCGVLVELGRAASALPYLPTVVLGGSVLATPLDGRITTAALSEEDNDEPRRPATHAERSAAGWVLTGAKTGVPAGPVADLFLVPATGPEGPAVFLVTPADEGITVTRQHLVDGDDAALLDLAGVPLPDDRYLGGAEMLDRLVDRAVVGQCAHQLGVLERALELTAAYARTRVQFGRPIGEFQAVAQRLADGYIDVEAVRLTMWQAAWRIESGLPAATEIATAKFWAADAGHRVAHTAVHVHGGVGIDVDYPLHRYFVAAKRNEFALGAATVHLRRLGAVLAEAV